MIPSLSIVMNTRQQLKPMKGLTNADIYQFLMDSLKEQMFQDFELIIVDGFFEERSSYVDTLFEKYGFPGKHIPPAPNNFFHRKEFKNPYQISRYRNSGFVMCRAPLVMFIDDCICPSTKQVIDQMMKAFFTYGAIIKPITHRHKLSWDGKPEIIYDPDISQIEKSDPHRILVQSSGQKGGVFFYPSRFLEELNGFDEVFDGGKGNGDCDFNNRVDLSGIHRFQIANGFLAPQFSFGYVDHEHKEASRTDIVQCNEAYAQWIFGNTKSRGLKANSKKLTEKEIEEILSICKSDKCPLWRGNHCQRQSGINRTILEKNQPVFDLSSIRSSMLEKFSSKTGSFDPWAKENPFDFS